MSVVKLQTGQIIYKDETFEKLKVSSSIAKKILSHAISICQEGISTLEIDNEIEKFILTEACIPAFKGYHGFPFSSCISVNDTIVHGIPDSRKLQEGDVVSIDLGVIYEGLYSDNARTLIIGQSKNEDTTLVKAAEECFKAGLEQCQIGKRTGDVGHAIHKKILQYKNSSGKFLFKMFPKFQGHGIGLTLHEFPSFPNFGFPDSGIEIKEGMCFCIEPVLTYRSSELVQEKLSTGLLQFKTHDGLSSAHYENQIYMSHTGPIVLTD